MFVRAYRPGSARSEIWELPQMPYYSRETGHTLNYGKISTATNVMHVNKKFGDFTGKFIVCFLNHGILVIGQ